MKKKSLSSEVFNNLCRGIDIYFSGFVNPRAMVMYGYDEFLEMQDRRKQYEIKKRLRRMEEKKIIKIEKRGKEIVIALSTEAKLEKIKREMHAIDKIMPDGEVCLISFDIPERIRRVRDMLRSLFKELGFVCVHRSVWEGKRDLMKEVKLLAKILNVEDWLIVYKASRAI